MSMYRYDAELDVQRRKDQARAAAAGYYGSDEHAQHLARGRRARGRHAQRRALIAAGGALITLGRRLQGELDELAATPVMNYE